MSIPFPNKPWEDQQEFSYLLEDGTLVIGTYDTAKNAWTFKRVEVDTTNPRPPIFDDTPPVVYPDDTLPDNSLVVGDIWYDTSDPTNAVKYVWDGDKWVPAGDGLQTTATLPLAVQPQDLLPYADPESIQRLNSIFEENGVLMQSDLNEESLYTLFNQRRKQTRARTTTDFIQNTVNEGEWEYDDSYQANELPDQGKFALFDGSGSPVNLWEAVEKIVINGTGRNLESLADVRRGSVFNFFDVVLNSFAQYVVQNVQFIGSPQGGQFWIDLDVSVITGRAAGSIPPGTVSEIQVIQQRPCIVNNSSTPPLVNNDGFLWYDKDERKMYVSNWSSLNGPNGHASWISTDYKDVVKTVTYYTDPASFDDQDGAIAGDGVNWYISPQAAFLTPGAQVEIADEGHRTVVSVEQKNDLTMPYTAIVLDSPVNLNQADNTITHLHTPYEGSDQGQPGPDGDFLPLTGGTLTGPVNTKTTGYAFEVVRRDITDPQTGDFVDDVPLVTAYTGSSRSEFTYNKLPGQYTGDNIEIANVGWVKSYVLDNGGGGGGNINLDDYATIEYVDEQDAKKLSLTGGTVTGGLVAQGGLRVYSIDTGGPSNLFIKHNGDTRMLFDDSGAVMQGAFRLFNEGTEDSHLVTKKYVDDAVETGVGGVDLDDYATIVYSDAGDGAVLDEVLKELDRFREEIGLAEYSFNYTLREDNNAGITQDGDCLIGDTDPEQNQMFILDDVQRDGTALDHQLIQPGDEIVFEQDLGHKIIYEVVEVRDTADQVILSVNFLRYAGDNVRGFQSFAYDRLALIYKEGQLDGGGGGGNMDDYLPLTGGTMEGDIKMSFGKHIDSKDANGQNFRFLTFNAGSGLDYQGSTSNDNNVINRKAMVAYVDSAVPDLTNYIKRGDDAILGDMSASSLRTLVVDSGNSSNLNLKCNGATKVYVGSSATTIQGPLKLNTQGVNDDEVVTKGYVDSVASGGGGYVVPEWTWVNVLWDSANPGNWGMVDRNNQSTSRFADCRGIWWTTLDRAGNRPFNDANWQDWQGYFPGPLYIQRNGESIFRVAQASGLNSFVLIDFVRDMGLYYIGWDQSDLGTAIGGYTGVTNGGAYGLLIPEFINQ